MFYYLMKSHYSQTLKHIISLSTWFYYLMKSHYSQTFILYSAIQEVVLLPYEITLFSNNSTRIAVDNGVLLPYEITLFSNITYQIGLMIYVLLPYEITLFSNLKPQISCATIMRRVIHKILYIL